MADLNAQKRANFKKCITKRKKESDKRSFKIGAFDFETTALDGDVVYGTLQCELKIDGERTEIIEVFSASAMLDQLFNYNAKKMRWYAHNLEYDLLFLLQEANKQLCWETLDHVELCERGMNQFYKATFYRDDQKLELYDSMALFGFSLDVFTKNFSSVGQKLNLDFEKETFDIYNAHHIEYAKQDTRALLDSVINFDRAIYNIFGVHVKGTISSTALAAWEVTLKDDDCFTKLTPKQNEFTRHAYFGGLVFLTTTEIKTDVVSVDVNSMYPYCMRQFGVPVGVPELTTKLITTHPAIYKVKVKAPEYLQFGCLGYRDKKGIAWALGEFETYAFNFEIERAIKWGYEIEIIQGLLFEKYIYPFNDLVDLCELKRAEYKGQPFEIVVKLIQNSIYGKFATKEDGKEIIITGDDVELDDAWRPYLDCNAGGYPIQNCYERDTNRDTYYMLPHWAACITARARGELLDIFELTDKKAFYGDTDSIKMSRNTFNSLNELKQLKLNNAYGALKLDDEYKTFKAIAPKVYTYEQNDKFSGRGKGIPQKQRNSKFWQQIYLGNTPTVTYNSMGSLKSAIKKGGTRKLKEQTRTSTNLANSDGWYDNAGKVYAVKIIENKREKQNDTN